MNERTLDALEEAQAEIERLKAELARLTPSGQVAEDAAAALAPFEGRVFVPSVGKVAIARLAAKAQGYEAAVADNATLLEALDGATQLLAEYDAAGAEEIDRHIDVTDSAAHPGAALLKERHEQAELVKMLGQALDRHGRHGPGCLTKKAPNCRCGLTDALRRAGVLP